MKTCVSCKHFAKQDKIPEILGKCKAPQSYTISLVTGKPDKQEFEFCSALRREIPRYSTCGIEADWWEHKDEASEVVIPEEGRKGLCSLTKRLISLLKRS